MTRPTIRQPIPVCEPFLAGREAEYVADAVKTNWISSAGSYLTRFEQEFARYCGVKHGIATTNGTTALHLAVAAAGLGPSDEIIMPDFTIAACAFAAMYLGARPVFVDVEPDTWCMRVDQVADKVTARTKAIMVVHMYGHPCDMDPLCELARKRGLFLLEDAAEVHGAEYKGKRCGGLGDAACFSFYSNKIITTGEGGMVVTSDAGVAERCRVLRNLAFNPARRFLHDSVGWNHRMTNVQAAIGLAQLEKIDEYVERRRRNAAAYIRLLRDVEGLTLPVERPWAKNVYWMFGVVVDEQAFGCDRDALMAGLSKRGVETRTFFIPMHQQPFLQKAGLAGDPCPVSADLGRRGFYLPSSTGLSPEEIRFIVDAVVDVQREARQSRPVAASRGG